MPEMPELETIRRTLEPHLKGRRIIQVEVLLSRQIKWPEPDQFVARLVGCTIERLERKGKYLLLVLDNDIHLVFHLRMTGQLCYREKGAADGTHSRIIFNLDGGDRLIYGDVRTFGTLYAMKPEELPKIQGLAELGPEPLSEEFTIDYLRTALAKKKTKIKGFLLDQRKIGGLGNIYVDEALFLSGIHPLRTAGSVTEEELPKLHEAINRVIREGIEDGGTTFRDYRNGDGGKGSHQENLFAYGRDGEPCRVCGTAMEKIRVGGRGTHFCPKCQPFEV